MLYPPRSPDFTMHDYSLWSDLQQNLSFAIELMDVVKICFKNFIDTST